MENDLVWLPDVLAIACILGSAMTIFAVVLQFRKEPTLTTKLSSIYIAGEHEKIHYRALGKMETVFYNLHKDGGLQISMAALVKTSARLDQTIVHRVIKHLLERHPMLGMRIIDVNGQLHFASGIKKIPFETIISDNWLERFEDSLTVSLDETKYLWKLLMVENTGQVKENVPRIVTFIFTFHHAIVDGLCKARLVTEFIECLNKILKDITLEQNTYSLLPPLDYYINSLIERSSSEKILFQTIDKLHSNSSLIRVAQKKYLNTPEPNQNAFIEKIGAVCIDNSSIEAKTSVIPLKFTKFESERMLKACRSKDVTVQGMLMAAACITMKELLDGTSLTENEVTSVQMRTTVNMRRYLDGNVPEEYIGSYFVGLFGQDISIPKSNSESEQFWTCARHNTHNLKLQLQNRKFITKFWNLLETAYYTSKSVQQNDDIPKSQTGPNRLNELLSLNNYGRCPSKETPADSVRLQGCFCAVAEHRRGPIFTINGVTVEGHLCLSFVYYTNITTKDMANNFANSVKSKVLKYS